MMDANTTGGLLGIVGGIVGSVVGLIGGGIGTYASINSTRGPRERAAAVRMAVFVWLWVGGLLGMAGAGMFLLPQPWRGLTSFVALPIVLPMVFMIPRMNRRLAEARSEDQGRAAVGP